MELVLALAQEPGLGLGHEHEPAQYTEQEHSSDELELELQLRHSLRPPAPAPTARFLAGPNPNSSRRADAGSDFSLKHARALLHDAQKQPLAKVLTLRETANAAARFLGLKAEADTLIRRSWTTRDAPVPTAQSLEAFVLQTLLHQNASSSSHGHMPANYSPVRNPAKARALELADVGDSVQPAEPAGGRSSLLFGRGPVRGAAQTMAQLAVFLQSVEHHRMRDEEIHNRQAGAATRTGANAYPEPQHVCTVTAFHYIWREQLHEGAQRQLHVLYTNCTCLLQELALRSAEPSRASIGGTSRKESAAERASLLLGEKMNAHVTEVECRLMVKVLYGDEGAAAMGAGEQNRLRNNSHVSTLLDTLAALAEEGQAAQLVAKRLSLLSPNTAVLGQATFRKLGYNVVSDSSLAVLRSFSAATPCHGRLSTKRLEEACWQLPCSSSEAYRLPTRAFLLVLLGHQLSMHLRQLEPLVRAFRKEDTAGDGWLTRAQFSRLFTRRLRHEDYAVVPKVIAEHVYSRNHLGNVFLKSTAGSVDHAACEEVVQGLLERLDPRETNRIPLGWMAAAVCDVEETCHMR